MKKIVYALLLAGLYLNSFAQPVTAKYEKNRNQLIFDLSNNKVTQRVIVADSVLALDELLGNKEWLSGYNNHDHSVFTDGNYALKMMWTDWSAPGKIYNGDLQVTFTKREYKYDHYDFKEIENGGRELELYFTPFDQDNTIQLRLTYQLLPGKFYSRRKISVEDTTLEKDWLQEIVCREGVVGEMDEQTAGYQMREENNNEYQKVSNDQTDQKETTQIIKRGDFGQPCAADFTHGGVFFGTEYPSATNLLKRDGKSNLELSCHELIGKVVRNEWVESDWTVEGLAPDHYVKDWFFNYLPDIRVAPNKPYALYNSWYDLRSPVYPGVQADHVMNEKNILHIIELFKKDMIEPYGMHLDAFVLDDGWDNYESDWQMRTFTFPHGVKPIVEALKPLGTTLGLWFGPTGGYSFRMRRIDWMKNHGYETVGHTANDAMMDIAGPKYSALFEKRTTDFAKQGVGYFKWDGIQFSSSEPDNGHPVGYLSRRAALESVIAKCKAVRAVNPNEFLNITSGTWMSPWWMQYANQIWMQGADYGFADVPSVNERDGAVTYKDFVLYDDFHNQDVWFPVSNLMTHGIIKGSLESVGGNDDPLDKFTDDAVFYFGRGVTMYELYISPDILTPGEWNALSKSLAWAKDRFDILNKTYMVGGDPTKGETYGYVHYRRDSGIIAVRNPQMNEQKISIKLSPDLGMNMLANNLVLERVYPTHWISPDLYAAGATVTLPLQGYEAAIYEVYPLQNASRPLLAGVTFETTVEAPDEYQVHILQADGHVIKLLNPEKVRSISVNGTKSNILDINLPGFSSDKMISKYEDRFANDSIITSITMDESTKASRYIIFLKPDSSFEGKTMPNMELNVDGQEVVPTVQQQQGSWATYSFVIKNAGTHQIQWNLKPTKNQISWSGTASIWITGQQELKGCNVTINMNDTIHYKPMLPSPYLTGTLKKEIFLDETKLDLSK
jgi:Melibiase